MEEQENKMLGKLYIYRSQMAPHHKKRMAGKLLLEAIEYIEQLIDANTKLVADETYWKERAATEQNARQEVHEAQKYWEGRAMKAELTLSSVCFSLRYAFENLPYPDTLTGNREYDIARIALGIELDKCKPISNKNMEEHERAK
jgi:hypothetical protein